MIESIRDPDNSVNRRPPRGPEDTSRETEARRQDGQRVRVLLSEHAREGALDRRVELRESGLGEPGEEARGAERLVLVP